MKKRSIAASGLTGSMFGPERFRSTTVSVVTGGGDSHATIEISERTTWVIGLR